MSAPVVHFEIGCRDAERAKKFYGDLFGWSFQAYGAAAMISNIAREQGINERVVLFARERTIDVSGGGAARPRLVIARLQPGT